MARANYGAFSETPEVVFGGSRPRNPSLCRSEFNQVITSNNINVSQSFNKFFVLLIL
jgi:hypothetical protein